MADVPALPSGLALRLVYGALLELRGRTERRAFRNPSAHRVPPATRALREGKLAGIDRQLAALRDLMAGPLVDEIDADVAALLGAWALGSGDAPKALKGLLAETEHPAARDVAGVRNDEIVEACRLIAGAEKST